MTLLMTAPVIEALRLLHREHRYRYWDQWATSGYLVADECWEDGSGWPCRTSRALASSDDDVVVREVVQLIHAPYRFLWWRRCPECRAAWPCHTAEILSQASRVLDERKTPCTSS